MNQPVDGLSAQFVADALGQTNPSPDNDHVFSGISSDTRADIDGQLFIAIRGDRFDGHDYIHAAVAGGARAVITQRQPDYDVGVPVFVVNNSIAAWRRIAHAWRRRFTRPVVAIGGAAGKTTTKQLLAAILRAHFNYVLVTEGSQNGYLGIAMTLTALRAHHDVAVVEVGIDAPGAMSEHAHLVAPDVAVITSIGPEHLDQLHNIETVAYEESRLLIDTHQRGGVIGVNGNEPQLDAVTEPLQGARLLRYKLNAKVDTDGAQCDYTGRVIEQSGKRQLCVYYHGVALVTVKPPLPGRHNVMNTLSAIVIAHHLGLNAHTITAGLADFKPDARRSNIRTLARGIRVLADHYNASPLSMRAAIETLYTLPAQRHWAVLADMLELGSQSKDYHQALAPLLAHCHGVLLYGDEMRALAQALQAQSQIETVMYFDSRTALIDYLEGCLHVGDAVLVKGSRGMALDEVVAHLYQTYG